MDFQLKRLRKQRGLTQSDVAEALKTTKKRVGDWERIGNIRLDDACEVADFLHCSLDELAGRWEYVGAFSDERQRQLNDAYGYLDDGDRDAALGAVLGIASAHARKKAALEGPEDGQRSA